MFGKSLIMLAEKSLTFTSAFKFLLASWLTTETNLSLNTTGTAITATAINKIRRRANGMDINTPNPSVDLPLGLSIDDFRKEVIKERAWEFAFEGKRWPDLVRTETVEAVNANHPFAGPATKQNYLMPIPAEEILANPNLTQNTGY